MKTGSYNTCRFCNSLLTYTFCNLGNLPLANTYLKKSELTIKEAHYPLHVYVCSNCLLVQSPPLHTPKEIFSEYAYFSSYSSSWLAHSKEYVQMSITRFKLTSASQVIELASNDGYLLQFFKELNIPVLGIEPAKNVAQAAIAKGIPTLQHFFDSKFALTLEKQADLLIGNNVLAHVPNLNDFVAAMKYILKPQGIITMEFPHLLNLIEENQFDTIYHEHFFYFSFSTAKEIFASHNLEIFDVDLLYTHGGSLRIYAKHKEDASKQVTASVQALAEKEYRKGLCNLSTYLDFGKKIETVKTHLLEFIKQVQKENKIIIGYGAPAKANTLLNYCGLNSKSLPFTVDLNLYKQGKFLPGTRIPICPLEKISEVKPNYLWILPWNLKNEIMKQMSYIRDWEGKFMIAIPKVEIL